MSAPMKWSQVVRGTDRQQHSQAQSNVPQDAGQYLPVPQLHQEPQTRQEYKPPLHQPGFEEHQKEAPTEHYKPRTSTTHEVHYILSLGTDEKLAKKVTSLRQQYFPKHASHATLAAHLTLFHALPGSRLESDIIPHIKDIVSKTAPFQIKAGAPRRMKHGFNLPIPKAHGGAEFIELRKALQTPWFEFLSDQDAGNSSAHYTIMNKVEDEQRIEQSFQAVSASWDQPTGTALGIALWQYDKGDWIAKGFFDFMSSDKQRR